MDEDEVLEQQVDPVDVEIQEPTEDEVVEEEAVEENFFTNLADELDDTILASLASQLVTDYRKDKESRSDWEKSYTSGLDLLGFKYNDEGQPFRGASSVTHPLLAESVTQFQAQAYKELLPADGPVKSQILGDRTPDRESQAQRVQEFMNYMVMEKMEEYTPEFDQMLFYLPLAGSTFKKVYYDEIMQRAVSKFTCRRYGCALLCN
jgi:hypothetical protein